MCNSCWQDCSTVASTILQKLLARLFNSDWHNCWTVSGLILQQLLARLLNSGWHDSSTVTSIILQQSLARLLNSHWYNSWTVAGTILQQSQARFFLFPMLAEFFNSDVQCWKIVPCTCNMTHDPHFHTNRFQNYQLLNMAVWWG